MSVTRLNSGLQLPPSLEEQLHEFRRRLWTIKIIEAICGALFGIVISYLTVFILDRLLDTPTWTRIGIFAIAVSGCTVIPLSLHRWFWCHRRLEQLAHLISRRYPSIGDQMLGVIELVRSEFEQARSRALCVAAIDQVASEAKKRDFRDAVPNPRHRLWAWMAAVPTVIAIAVLVMFPSAAANAWWRFLAPWQPIPRYTFTAIEQIPQRTIVPHGEPFDISVGLLKNSSWQPSSGTARLGGQMPVSAQLCNGRYEFSLPTQIEPGWLKLYIGDARQQTRIEPMLRPELSDVTATVTLPKYLGREQALEKDLRGGTLTVLIGSTARFSFRANRDLSTALIDDQAVNTDGTNVTSFPVEVNSSRKLVLKWKDKFDLMGQEPFTVSINALEDDAPSISCEDLPRQKVVLDSETLNFTLRAQDDFGIKVVGIEVGGDRRICG